MKIYLPQLNLSTYNKYISNKGDEHIGSKSVVENIWILTDDGKYKVIDDNYFKYKLHEAKPTEIVENYIDNAPAYCDYSVFKKNFQTYVLPMNHVKVHIKYIFYNIDTSISLVVEKVDDEYTDIYFTTKNDINSPDIKNTIISFLSILS